MSITVEQIQGLTGNVYGQNSEKIGSIGEIYLDDESGRPSWVTTKTGLFGSSESFAPLEGARIDGDDIYLDFDQDKVKSAPRIDPDGSLSPQEEDELYQYYGLSNADGAAASNSDNPTLQNATQDAPRAADRGAERGNEQGDGVIPVVAGKSADNDNDTVADTDTVDESSSAADNRSATGEATERMAAPGPVEGDRADDHDRFDGDRSAAASGSDHSESTGLDRSDTRSDTDNAMTRSEERLNVGTETRESGRARLRKHVTTEAVSHDVPVSHEEVTLEREPIDQADAVAHSGAEIGADEHEVVRHEEVPVVEKDVVAVERVKLGTETVTENQTVPEDVRKEEVEMVQPDAAEQVGERSSAAGIDQRADQD